MTRTSARLFLVVLLGAATSACSSSSDGSTIVLPPTQTALSGVVNQPTLTGKILAPGGGGLKGATVNVKLGSQVTGTTNEFSAITDEAGNFIIQDPPTGAFEILIEGAGAGEPGEAYPDVTIPALIEGSGENGLPNPVTLPLLDPANSVVVGVDASGFADQDYTVGTGTARLFIPKGTEIQVNGAAATAAVTVNVAVLSANEIPIGLPAGERSRSFVAVITTPPGAQIFGANVVAPNPDGVGVGQTVKWFNLPTSTIGWIDTGVGGTGTAGQLQGVVVGAQIEAQGLVTDGLQSFTLPALSGAETQLTGRVVLAGTPVTPVKGALIRTDTGQFGTSGTDGTFSTTVLAYDASGNATDVSVEVVLPVSLGGERRVIPVTAGTIQQDGTTSLGDIVFTPLNVGAFSILVTDSGAKASGTVTISGPTPRVGTLRNGAYFNSLMTPGDYTASFTFPGDAAPRVVSFPIVQNKLTTVALQRNQGDGTHTLKVVVLDYQGDTLTTAPVAVSGASVMLVGSDKGSSGGLVGVTNTSGVVMFEGIDYPVTATAQFDQVAAGQRSFGARRAISVVDVSPVGDCLQLPLFGGDEGGAEYSSTVAGTITGTQGDPNVNYQVIASGESGGSQFTSQAFVSDQQPTYSMSVPAGIAFDVVLMKFDDFSGGAPSGVIIKTGFNATAGQTTTVDFDLANLVAVDQTLDLTINNIPSAQTSPFGFVGFDATLPNGGRVDFQVTNQDISQATGPIKLTLPNLAALPLSSPLLSVNFSDSGSGKGSGRYTNCDVPLPSIPTALTVDLPPFVDIVAPLDGSVIDPSVVAGLTIQIDPGQPAFVGNGPTFFTMTGATSLPIGFVVWGIFAPDGTTMLTLPPTAKPMFGTNDYRYLEACIVDIHGMTYDHDSFFGASLPANLAALDTTVDALCQTCASVFFYSYLAQ